MLPGFRAVIAGIVLTILLPLVAFGIAANFRSANGTTLSPFSTTPTGPALIEYYWSQFYAPTALHPADLALRAEAGSRPENQSEAESMQTAPRAALALESPRAFDVPPVAELPGLPETSKETLNPIETMKPADAPKIEVAIPADAPKTADQITDNIPYTNPDTAPSASKADRIARLPDAVIEAQPAPAPTAAAVLPATQSASPAVAAAPENPATQNPAPSPGAAPMPTFAALAPPESLEGEPDIIEQRAGPVTGQIPLPPKRPVQNTKRPSRIVHRSRPRVYSGEPPFIPLKNSLFESLFGGISKL